ncbi:sulfatase-like hydrolase/transferase [uncultured Psychroserpens sp.]|uniref:sulfatase-like hydrolase/transferase n=1 Tax=uncultured Psychroserpens sp. TaxID=255436 RepID=UPI00260CFB83|nr:sulfatase-like hydrolase/transferase [uncultured Psychroserpens sp.]
MGVLTNLKTKIRSFANSNKEYPIIAALGAGLYPFLHNYISNFTLVNSWSQLWFFLVFFIGLPMLVFLLANLATRRIEFLKKYHPYVLPILNLTTLVFLIIISIYGPKKKLIALGLLVAVFLAIILRKHFKKIIIFQLILAVIGFFNLIPKFMLPLNYSNQWMTSKDDIISVKFKKTPNVYIIQPDGYTNFSELKKENYDIDNSKFEAYLESNDFKLYNDFRSNYFSTLSSNSSMFAMNHHYYNNVKGHTHEFYNARKIIIGDNPVVSIFKENDYKTFLILENSYLLVNRSEIKYDYCNINYNEVPFLARGFGINKDTQADLEQAIINNKKTNNFYFIEQISPGHISTFKRNSKGKEEERNIYIDKLKEANQWLTSVIKTIDENDKDAIVVIVADHGGFVGYDYSLESTIKQDDPTLINSAFSAALAIKWPDNNPPEYDSKLKTNVNLFRILFSYLGENKDALNYLEKDDSYIIIKEGAPNGIYKAIDEKGNITFDKIVND